MKKTSIKGDIVKSYIAKFPKATSKNLAQKIFKENGSVFSDMEDARSIVRYYRGAHGKESRRLVRNPSIRDKKDIKLYYDLPEEYNEEVLPYKIPKQYNKVGILSDLHIPYHSNEAIISALEFLKSKDVNCIILNGDVLDCYQLSRFEKDPRKRNMKHELEATRQFLDVLKKHFPKTKIVFKIGNHEVRWMKYMVTKAPELLDIDEFRLDVLLRFGERNIDFVHSSQMIMVGKLSVLHGHELVGGVGGVNPARTMFLRTNESLLVGHFHRTSSHTETSLSGRMTTTHSTGCLCYMHPDYMPYNKWNYGFAYVEVLPSGEYHLQNLRIDKGKVY